MMRSSHGYDRHPLAIGTLKSDLALDHCGGRERSLAPLPHHGSVGPDDPKIETVGLGEIHRHLGPTATHGDLSARAAKDQFAAGRSERCHGQRARACRGGPRSG